MHSYRRAHSRGTGGAGTGHAAVRTVRHAGPQSLSELTSFFQNNANAPAPETGHQRFYAVVTPPGINNGDSGAIGEHKSFSYNGATAYYCWVDSAGGLTDNASDGVVNIFSHELVEACTDPLGSAIHVNGTGVSNDEIGDTCNNEFAIVEMNGVNCNVQCYWSAADNACIIPLGSLSFLIDKNTFGKDEVQRGDQGQQTGSSPAHSGWHLTASASTPSTRSRSPFRPRPAPSRTSPG